MTQIKLYVSNIINHKEKGIYGIEGNRNRVNKDLSIIFKRQQDIDDLLNLARQQKEGLAYIHRFCQFIVYINLSNDLKNNSLAFFDCFNDMDTALDVHLHFTRTGFDKLTKEDFMNQFLEIREIYEQVKDMAVLTKGKI